MPSFSGERVFAVADLNGDGKADLITKLDSPSRVLVRLGTGAGGFSTVISVISDDGRPAGPALADFDRDGDPDLAFLIVTGSGLFGTRTSPRLLVNDGAGHLSFGPRPNLGPDIPLPPAAADLNADGRPDLVAGSVRGPADNDSLLMSALGNGDLTFAAPATSPVGGGAGPLVLGDYNRDGRIDAAVGGAALSGDGKGGFGNLQEFPGNVRPSYRADFNRDGIADLVGELSGTSPSAVLLGEGDGSFRTPNGIPGFPRAVGDFTRDGKPDILVVDEGLAGISVLLNTTP